MLPEVMGTACSDFRLWFMIEKRMEEEYTAQFSVSSIVLCMSIA